MTHQLSWLSAVVGAALVLAVLLVLAFVFIKRRRRRSGFYNPYKEQLMLEHRADTSRPHRQPHGAGRGSS